jgi:hypothetical protein
MAPGLVAHRVSSLLVQEEGGEALPLVGDDETQLQDRAEPLSRFYRAGRTGLGARAARVSVMAARFCLLGVTTRASSGASNGRDCFPSASADRRV